MEAKPESWGTPTPKVTREPTTLCLPPGCPEAEEPANLESFGGEDPRPELYLCPPPRPALPAAHALQPPYHRAWGPLGVGEGREPVLRAPGERSSLSPVLLSPEEPHLPTATSPTWEGRWGLWPVTSPSLTPGLPPPSC